MTRATVRVAKGVAQAKMTVTAVNDPAEVEADKMADQVVAGIAAGAPAAALAAPAAGGVARAGAEEELQGKRSVARAGAEEELQGKRTIARAGAEEELQGKRAIARAPMDEELPVQGKRSIARAGVPINDDASLETEADVMGEKALKRAASNPAREAAPAAGGPANGAAPAALGPQGGEVPAALESQIASASGGQPLPAAVRAQMEAGFGADFSAVKVHLNSDLAPRLGALAFAQGTDVHFAPGKFDGGSPAGQHLIAHELTHVVQQGGAIGAKLDANVARDPDKPQVASNDMDDQEKHLPHEDWHVVQQSRGPARAAAGTTLARTPIARATTPNGSANDKKNDNAAYAENMKAAENFTAAAGDAGKNAVGDADKLSGGPLANNSNNMASDEKSGGPGKNAAGKDDKNAASAANNASNEEKTALN